MATETIDHPTLLHLVEAGVVRAAHVIGQAGGWVLSVQYGMAERFLAAQRSGKLRLFRKLETVTAYLKEIGISRFEVDASGYDAAEAKRQHKRPDRAEALKRAHEAAEHDAWFREQVQSSLDEADRPDAVLAPHAAVMADLKAHLDGLAARAGKDA
jgi:hypothetical protein